MNIEERIDFYLNETISDIPNNPKQKKKVNDMKKQGWKIVTWESDFVGMVDKKRNPAEVYPDGSVKYPKKKK